jgi:diamine N-acetyltransferase
MEPGDIDLLFKWENNREIWKVSNTLSPFSKYILEKYIENSHLDIYQTRQLRMMIDLENESGKRTIGCVDLFDFDPFHLRAGIGILIASSDDRNKGYASGALQEIIHYSFNYLHLHQLYCNITVDNSNSLKLFENAGFIRVGIKKDWIKNTKGFQDEVLLQLINT